MKRVYGEGGNGGRKRSFHVAETSSNWHGTTTTVLTNRFVQGSSIVTATDNASARKVLWVDAGVATTDGNSSTDAPVGEDRVSNDDDSRSVVAHNIPEGAETEYADDGVQAISLLQSGDYEGVYLSARRGGAQSLVRLLQSERILEGMPDGVALINENMAVTWANKTLQQWAQVADPRGLNFYAVLGNPQIMGPDFCPFHTALATSASSSSTLQTEDNRYFQVHVAPLRDAATDQAALVATVTDITGEINQQNKLAAIHQAGIELTDITPDEISSMDTFERIELLKDNIRHYTKDLLNVDVIEIRLLEQTTRVLQPLLGVGIDDTAANRPLEAKIQGNGVTGYVAATGKSYLCQDATQDPLYLSSFGGAASSLTVPLLLHETVIGTINVESNTIRAFDTADLQFLEIFARDVAVALNTLELLERQENQAAARSCSMIHRGVAVPLDNILNDAVNVIEQNLGHDVEVVTRLRRVLENARAIRSVIQNIGQQMAPAPAVPAGVSPEQQNKLLGKRILVVDEDAEILNGAHDILDPYGCIVETAHSGDEAVYMYRNSGMDPYDVVISAIRLPDYSGYQLMLRLMKVTEYVPMALTSGFGYDPGHSIVNARKAGLHPKALLYKPFKLQQLLTVIETLLDYQPGDQGTAPPESSDS